LTITQARRKHIFALRLRIGIFDGVNSNHTTRGELTQRITVVNSWVSKEQLPDYI